MFIIYILPVNVGCLIYKYLFYRSTHPESKNICFVKKKSLSNIFRETRKCVFAAQVDTLLMNKMNTYLFVDVLVCS